VHVFVFLCLVGDWVCAGDTVAVVGGKQLYEW